jgi:Cu/Ag efflux protein CusF
MRSRHLAIPVASVLALACLHASAQQAAPAQKAGSAAATGAAIAATAPGQAVVAATVKTSATIVGLDPATRSITLKRKDGKVTTVNAGEEVRNYDQLKVGDTVTAEYVQALSLDLKKGGAAKAGVTGEVAAARSKPGQKPGGAVGRQVVVLADVVNVDAQKKLVTLKGPAGNTVDLAVEDPAQLKNIKKGDQVEAVYTEALAIKVEAAKK